MSLMHFYYDPLTEFDRLFDNALTTRFFRPTTSTTSETGRDLFKPRMDVHENADNNLVTATFDLPGLTRDQVNIEVHENSLIVSGETSAAQQKDEPGYTLRERSWGKFSRSLRLPPGTKPEDLKAKMDNGVLNVTFPKGQLQQPKRITIE